MSGLALIFLVLDLQVPDEAATKCSNCDADFSAFVRRVGACILSLVCFVLPRGLEWSLGSTCFEHIGGIKMRRELGCDMEYSSLVKVLQMDFCCCEDDW